MAKILDIDETLRQIVQDEDANGRLKENYFSEEVLKVSRCLRKLRDEYRKKKSVDLKLKIQATSESLSKLKANECELVIARVKKYVDVSISDHCKVNGKTVYKCDDLDTLMVSKYVMHDLVENYHVTTNDRNTIVEELFVLLNNNTPKMLLRSDIKSFFESIPQEPLMKYIEEDSRISAYSLKYLRLFLEKYNALIKVANPKAQVGVGLPRGLCFSSVLSEIYLASFDNILKHSTGVYFYKRYVDDIIMLLSSEVDAIKITNIVRKTLLSMGLKMNDEKTMTMSIHNDLNESLKFTYLGYKFMVTTDRTELHLSDRKYEKYKYLIDQIFLKYSRTSHYRCRKAGGSNKKDALIVLKREINVLTGNGQLTQKKHFIKTGVFYSNQLLTNLDELAELDRYLESKINTISPPQNMFQYNGENQYEARMKDWKRLLLNYTFMSGFKKRRLCTYDDYYCVLTTLKRMYYQGNE